MFKPFYTTDNCINSYKLEKTDEALIKTSNKARA